MADDLLRVERRELKRSLRAGDELAFGIRLDAIPPDACVALFGPGPEHPSV